MTQIGTFMQVDLQNLFYAARNKGQRIDFEKIWLHFHERETEFLTDARIYMIRSNEFNSSKFEAKLKSIGYNLKIKEDKNIKKGKSITSSHDINIAIECIDRIETFDKWILMSGDGDFADLASYLKKKGKQTEIWSFKECHNPMIDPYADRIQFIGEQFFYKKPKVNVFGFNRILK